MKKLAIFLRKIADMLDAPVDETDSVIELDFPKRNLSFNAAVDSILCLSEHGRSHFFRRLVKGISKQDRVILDLHLQEAFDNDFLDTNFNRESLT